MRVVAFNGYADSGKTSAIVSVARQLTKGGYKVGTLKHINMKDFTIDKEGKDTWRYAAAGASIIVALAPAELTTIQREDTSKMSIDDLMHIFEARGVDYLLVEGLHRRLSRRRGVAHVLCARDDKDARELLKLHSRPICVLKRKVVQGKSFQEVPVLQLPRDLPRLMSLLAGLSPS